MIKRHICIALLFTGLMAPATAQQFRTGNDIWPQCVEDRAAVNRYAAGAFDAIIFAQTNFGDGQKNRLCVPNGIVVTQVSDMLCNHLRDAPEERHYSAAATLWVVMRDEWECPAE